MEGPDRDGSYAMTLEICIDRLASATAAQRGGAHRLEVCGALDVGGVTPSDGLLAQCLELGDIECVAMIRPHSGLFTYRADDLATMLRDVARAKQRGAHGVVFGALREDGSVDHEACRRLVDAARPLKVTFHRAFDLAQDPFAALDAILELGFNRLLTSGQAPTALQGASLIRELARRAGDQLAVIAGSGIVADEVRPLIEATGVRELHASANRAFPPPPPSPLNLVHPPRLTEEAAVRAILAAMTAATPPRI